MFTTDEKSNAYVAAYDVSDLTNISEIGRVQSNPGQNVIPHNTYFLNNYIVTSYYRDGVVVHDVTDPTNMIEVGNYDTSPAFTGNGFNGCWGVFPFFPSGNIIASDIENGLYVLGVNYTRASFLEGNVTNLITSAPINGATIQLITSNSTSTNVIGGYKTGVATAGTYDVIYSKAGYRTDTIFNVVLTSGNTTIVDVQLEPLVPFTFQVQVIDAITLNPIPNAKLLVENASFTNSVTTNALGNFTFNNFTEAVYSLSAGKWGYITNCVQNVAIDAANANYTISINSGYYDDFSFNYNWTISGTATTGIWTIGEPVGTLLGTVNSNPDDDVSNDCNIEAFVTGNTGGNAGDDDVDN